MACWQRKLLVCGALIATGCAPVPASPASPALFTVPQTAERGGHLVLIGGGRKPDAAMDLFVRLAGGARARIVILPTASGRSREAGDDYQALFRRLGATQVEVIHVDDRRDALRDSHARAVQEATGVWFSGGDQGRIASRIVDTPLHRALLAMKAAGGVVGGTSAGTACQSRLMLTGRGAPAVYRGNNVEVTRGLGLFEGVIVDQHFVARQRQSRLVSTVLEHPDQLGVGIDEATAAWVKPDGTMEVVGDGWIVVYDARGARVVRDAQERVGVADLRQHILLPGQRFDLVQRRVLSP